MPLVLSQMAPADFARAFEIVSLAFERRQPFMNQFYPQHDTPQGRINGGKRMLEMDADPHTTFLKVVDTDLKDAEHPEGLMIGMAKWNIYNGVMPETPDIMGGPWWDNGVGDKAYAETIAKAFFERRFKAIAQSKGRLTTLDYLAVDPAHGRRGAGSMLVDWGVKKADEFDLAGTIEGTDRGTPLYMKFGYKKIEDVSLAMPEPWADLPREEVSWLHRPRKSDGKMWD